MSGWIEWAGGLRPHPPQTRVRVKYRDGTEDEGESAFAYWSHEPNGRDIIAYRLVTEPEAQPPGDEEAKAEAALWKAHDERAAKAADVVTVPEDSDAPLCEDQGRPDDYEGPDVGMHDTEIEDRDHDGLELDETTFCQRFVAEMMTAASIYDGTPKELREYAEQAAPLYFAEDWQRVEGPEACAHADIGYWEEG